MFLYKKQINQKNYQVFAIKNRDLDFLGFRFFREKTILRKRNMYRISRKATRIHKKSIPSFKDACSMISYYGWIKRSDSYMFYNDKINKKK